MSKKSGGEAVRREAHVHWVKGAAEEGTTVSEHGSANTDIHRTSDEHAIKRMDHPKHTHTHARTLKHMTITVTE